MNNRGRMKIKYGRKPNKTQIWNLCDYLAKNIYTALVAFKKSNRMSIPGSIAMDCNYDSESLENEPEAERKWEDILDKMIFSFGEIMRDYPHSPYNLAWNKWYKEVGQFEPFVVKKTDEHGNTVHVFHSSFDFTNELKEEDKKYYDKINEGMHLFATYFNDLWD